MSFERCSNKCLTATVRWEDLAIVKEESLHEWLDSKIRFSDPGGENCNSEVAPPAISIASTDDSWSSDNTECNLDNAATTEVSPLMIPGDERNPKTRSRADARSVGFSTVTIREYSITLGDHPLCEMYPITLDWEFTSLDDVSVDDFESNYRRNLPKETEQSPIRNKLISSGTGSRRGIKARRLTVSERMSLLIESTGLSSQQLFQQERRRQLVVQEEKNTALNASLAFI
jgi:hypothetical protein